MDFFDLHTGAFFKAVRISHRAEQAPVVGNVVYHKTGHGTANKVDAPVGTYYPSDFYAVVPVDRPSSLKVGRADDSRV